MTIHDRLPVEHVPTRQYRCVGRCSCGWHYEAEADTYGQAETEAKEEVTAHLIVVGAETQ
jgi:hypothetical protein